MWISLNITREIKKMMKRPPHPGRGLREVVTASGWTISEVARRMGVSRQTLSQLLNEHAGISPSMALALENIGWSNAEFWLRVQSGYDLAHEKLQCENEAKYLKSSL